MAKTFSAPPFRRGKTSRAPPLPFCSPPLPVISDHSLIQNLRGFAAYLFVWCGKICVTTEKIVLLRTYNAAYPNRCSVKLVDPALTDQGRRLDSIDT